MNHTQELGVRPVTPVPPGQASAQLTSSPGRPVDFELRLEQGFGTLEPLREAWDEVAAALGASVYFSFDWCRTWWEHYGAKNELRVFLGFAEGKLTSILPLYIDRIGLKPLQFSVARLLGSNIPPKTFIPPVAPSSAEALFNGVLVQLLERDRCDFISLGPVSETCEFLRGFEVAARRRTELCGRVDRDRAGVHTLFPLPRSLDELFERMDKDERKKRKYEMRLLAREQAIARDVISDPHQGAEEFDRFAALHAAQWREKGKLGHFGSWPRGLEYNRALVRAMARLGRLRFVRILADGQAVSSQFAFVFGDAWFWELPARLTDKKWNRFSLGTTGFFCLADEAIKEGGRRIEGGIAHYDYKQKLGGTEHALEVLRVVGNRSGSRVRSRLFRWVRAGVLVLYYKVWYARISPRLPQVFRKPIWSFWLRLDF